MAEFYQVGKIKKRAPKSEVDLEEEIDLDNLNFTLRRSFDIHRISEQHRDAGAGVHGVDGTVMGLKTKTHPTAWPTVDNVQHLGSVMWTNETTGTTRLYIRNGNSMFYLDLNS